MPNDRYSRQTVLEEMGEKGQKTLAQKKVAIVGVGALGTVAAELLVRAGIGKMLLIDRDVVEESNLPRQFLYCEDDIGKSKALVAKERLQKINKKCKIQAEAVHLNKKNLSLLTDADLILDGTDNLSTRFLLNDYCRKEKKIWIYTAAIKTGGYVLPIFPSGPCLRCFLSEKAELETCATAGIINTNNVSLVSLQVTLALKILLKKEVEPELYYLDVWNNIFEELVIKKNKDCLTCNGKYPVLSKEENNLAIHFCGAQKYQIVGQKKNLKMLKEKWKKLGEVTEQDHTLHFQNITLFADGRALIRANSEKEALSVYDQYVGG